MRHVRGIELSKLEEWRLLGGWGQEHKDEWDADVADKDSFYKRPDEEQRFSERSQRVLKNNKAKLEKVLSKSPYSFNLFFLRAGRAEKKRWHLLRDNGGEGQIKNEKALEVLREENTDIDNLSWERSINFIFFGLPVTNRQLPPTPWIVLHWMAHALTAGADGKIRQGPEDWSNVNQLGIWDLFDAAFNESYKFTSGMFSDEVSEGGEVLPESDREEFYRGVLMPAVLTFRSARAKKLTSASEGVMDLFAQYIWNAGKLGLNRPPKNLRTRRTMYGVMEFEDNGTAFANFKKLRTELKVIFKRVMDNAVGKWYIM